MAGDVYALNVTVSAVCTFRLYFIKAQTFSVAIVARLLEKHNQVQLRL